MRNVFRPRIVVDHTELAAEIAMTDIEILSAKQLHASAIGTVLDRLREDKSRCGSIREDLTGKLAANDASEREIDEIIAAYEPAHGRLSDGE